MAVEQHVDAAVVGPHGDRAAGVRLAELDLLVAGQDQPATRRHQRFELHSPDVLFAGHDGRRWRTQLGGHLQRRVGVGLREAGRGGPERRRRGGHAQGLVWAQVVVAVHPGVDRGLGGGLVGEPAGVVEQLAAQRLMKTFDLAGGGRGARLGQPGGDAVLPADPLEEHLGRQRLGEPPGELLAVVGEHLRGHAVAGHRVGERLAHRTGGRLRHHRRDHHVPGVVIDARDQLAFPAAGQEHPTHDVELPQLHRRLPGPSLVLALVLLLLRSDQPVAHQRPVHRCPRRRRRGLSAAQLMHDPAGAPARMRMPQFADQRFTVGRQPSRRPVRSTRPVPQPVQPAGAVPLDPHVHRLPRRAVPTGHLRHRATGQHLQHRPVTQLNPPVHSGRRRSIISHEPLNERQACPDAVMSGIC
jgi:hypothetical protein